MRTGLHTPILVDPICDLLVQDVNGLYMDATFGCGGHAQALLDRMSKDGQLIAIDRDPDVVPLDDRRLCFQSGTFATVCHQLLEEGWANRFMGILVDFGVSSPQIDQPQRGFSFMREGPLDMRMDPRSGEPVSKWLERISESELCRILKDYADERYAKKIARAIWERQQVEPITTTLALAKLVMEQVPNRGQTIHPATKTFQALRMVINQEVEEIESFLEAVLPLLAPKGRFVALTFHGVETRLVRRFIQRHTPGNEVGSFHGKAPERSPLKRMKKLKPSAYEIKNNPRARSAMAFAVEKCV